MRVIDTKFSLISFWQQLVFTEAALLAHPDTAAMAAPFTTLLESFQELHGADLKTRRAVLQAQARAVIGDQNLDDGVRRLHSDTLSELLQDRSHAIFKALFSSDIGSTVRFALARQIPVVQQIVGNLALSIIPASLKPHIAKLEALITAGQEALAKRTEAAFGRTEANLGAAAWKDDVNAVRLTSYGALLGVAAKTRRPKAWAESFFMQSSEANENVEVDSDASVPTPDTPVVVPPPEG